MWVDFDELPLESRVWVFQAERILSDEEQSLIDNELKKFVGQWATHGTEMYASHTLAHNCFVVIAADEQKQKASGCSIDSFTSLFKSFGEQLKLSFFNRFSIAYKENAIVNLCSLEEFKSHISDGLISENTIVFDNLVETKKEFLSNWELPVKDSWLKRYL